MNVIHHINKLKKKYTILPVGIENAIELREELPQLDKEYVGLAV
jgi:hypothetical protein